MTASVIPNELAYLCHSEWACKMRNLILYSYLLLLRLFIGIARRDLTMTAFVIPSELAKWGISTIFRFIKIEIVHKLCKKWPHNDKIVHKNRKKWPHNDSFCHSEWACVPLSFQVSLRNEESLLVYLVYMNPKKFNSSERSFQ
jgi:hypothetical protein